MEPLTREGALYAGAEDSGPAQEQEFQLTQTVDLAISALKADFDTATVKARPVTGLLPETAATKQTTRSMSSRLCAAWSQISELTAGARVRVHCPSSSSSSSCAVQQWP